MTQILVQGSAILALGPFVETDNAISAADVIFPKHVLDGWQIVEAELPDDFEIARYHWQDGVLIPGEVIAPPVLVPQQVSRRQGLQAIYLMYEMTQDQVEQKIIDIVTDPTQQYLTLVEIRASQTFERQRATVVQMGAALDWDLDALFIKAGELP